MTIDEKILREALKEINDITEMCWEGAENSNWNLLTLGYVNGIATLALSLTESK